MLADRVRMGSGGGLNVPGPETLLYGDMEAGFFGEVPASELITGDSLANMVGISEGVSLFSDDPWLKFAYRGNVQFISKKPLRHSISFNHIENANCVEGGKTIAIKGVPYIVELIEGCTTYTTSGDRGSTDTEWNKLMIGIFSGSITYPKYAVGVKRWHVYDLSDLGLGYKNEYGYWKGNRNGYFAWCKGSTGSSKSYRGSGSCTSLANFTSSTPSKIHYYGWRPVLRLIG